ncbi:MAG: N2,N2-dimethylguanosine tRNA methyltransferase [Synechococcaceae cyanobacterium]|nr:N2,N2-dimethylguanosine tRNA methyltransferase [Synechococcaceae cyanobacterium]
MTPAEADDHHYREGAATLRPGSGFFRSDSRPARDLGVLLLAVLARQGPVQVLDAMAGCGIRSLRYGLEAGVTSLWVNDADPDRLPLLQANLAQLPAAVAHRCTVVTAQQLLATCLRRRRRFTFVDLDAFGCPSALVPLALEAVRFGGVLYLASSDGRSPTGHDRPAALRRFAAAARAHPASWELALRLQLAVVARAAWALGRGIEPLFSFSEGRTFRTGVRLRRRPEPGQEAQLGLLAHCHGCGEQQVQSLLRLGRWRLCCAAGSEAPLAVSGPLWIGPLQDAAMLVAMQEAAEALPGSLSAPGLRLLERLAADPGDLARCWPLALIARRLQGGPPRPQDLVRELRAAGWRAQRSGVMEGQLRSDAPWDEILAAARRVRAAK